MRGLAAGLACLVVFASGSALVAVNQRQAATDSARRADARSVSAQALLEPQAERALLFAAQAVQLDDNADTRSGLLSVLQRSEPLAAATRPGDSFLGGVAVSPDGRNMAVWGDTVTFFDVKTGQRVPSLKVAGLSDFAFSPDGARVAILGPTGIHLYDADLASVEAKFIAVPYAIDGRLAFLADGTRIVVAGHEKGKAWSAGTWDIKSGRSVAALGKSRSDLPHRATRVQRVTRLRSGSVLIVANSDSLLVAPSGASVLPDLPRQVTGGPDLATLAASPDGKLIATAKVDGTVAVWDAVTGRRLDAARGHTGPVESIAWTSDGRSFATAGVDTTAAVWSARPLTRRVVLRGQGVAVNNVVFSRDGRTLYTVGATGALLSWNLTSSAGLASRIAVPTPDAGYRITQRRFVPLGARQLIGVDSFEESHPTGPNAPRTYTLLRFCSRSEPGCQDPVRRLSGELSTISASSNGQRVLARVSTVAAISQWQLFDGVGRPLSVTKAPTEGAPLLNPDGTLVAASLSDQAVGLWDTSTMRPRSTRLDSGVQGPTPRAFSPDGSRLVVSSSEGAVVVLDVNRGSRIATLAPRFTVDLTAVAFSPDGRLLAGGVADGGVAAWGTADWVQVPVPAFQHSKRVNSVEFSADARRLLTAGPDDVILRDLTATTPAGEHFDIGSGANNQAIFLDGDRVLTYSDIGPALVWPIDTKTWIDRACALAGRNLNEGEWHSVLPDQAPRATCPH